MYHGANRLGGNSLLAAIYSGTVAAQTIGKDKSGIVSSPDFSEEILCAQKELDKRMQSKSRFSEVYIRQELAVLMKRNLGITRTEKDLNDGIESVDYFLSISDKLKYDCEISPYQGYSIKQMLLLAKAILMSAK